MYQPLGSWCVDWNCPPLRKEEIPHVYTQLDHPSRCAKLLVALGVWF